MTVGNRFLAWIAVGVSIASALVVGVVGFNSTPRTFNATSSGDTYISSFAPASTHGTETIVWVSNNNRFQNWTLIQFDISGMLRPGDLVVKSRMRLTISESNAGSWPLIITTGRTLTTWQENLTTFKTAPLLAFDSSTATPVGAGGAPPPGTPIWIDVTKQLHRWHSYGGSSNFGTVIMMGSNISSGAIAFASRDNSRHDKPLLEVTVQPGPRTPYGYTVGLRSLAVAASRNE